MPSCARGVPWGPSLRAAVFQQASGIAVTTGTTAWWTIKTMEEEERRERRRRQRQQVVNCCKQLAAFLFSHIGLAAMVVAYSIMGGFVFKAIEAPQEQEDRRKHVTELIRWKAEKIGEILQKANASACGPLVAATTTTTTVWRSQGEGCLNQDAIDMLNNTLNTAFVDLQRKVTKAIKEDSGWDGSDDYEKAMQWTLAGAILYAVTVITTIGYGHIAPKTTTGRLLTIMYALIGIPLTFLYLSNIGNFMADCFRLFYKRICCDIIFCQKCERKRKRERLKLRRRRELAAQRNVILNMLPPNDDVIDDDYDDDDVIVYKGGRVRDENPGFGWGSPHFGGGGADAPRILPCPSAAADAAANTFPSPPPSFVSTRKTKNATQEDEDDDDDDSTASQTSDETVRETAIIDDDDDDDDSDDVIRESEIIDDDEDVICGRHRCRRLTTEGREGRRSPPFLGGEGGGGREGGEFQRLDEAKETDILRDSSFESDRTNLRLKRKQKRPPLQRYRSDPFLHASCSSMLHDGGGKDHLPPPSTVFVARGRTPPRALTVRPLRRQTSKARGRTTEPMRRGTSVPNRSNSRRCPSAERSNTTRVTRRSAASKEAAVNERAKANWKKLIEYSKQLAAETERAEGSGHHKRDSSLKKNKKKNKKTDAKHDRQPEVKGRRHFPAAAAADSMKSPRRGDQWDDRRQGLVPWAAATGGHSGDRTLLRPTTKALNQSDDSFFTAASEGESSHGETEERRIQAETHRPKFRSASLNSVAIDISPPSVDSEADLPEFPEFIQDQPISFLDDPFDYEEEEEQEGKVTVPISICLIIISGYLWAGAALFAIWEEEWDLFEGSYFCFITLSTIGFGDIVPGTGMTAWESEAKLVLCALWLAFGLSLLAMCFNLMQEEVKDKCKWIGEKLGLLKDEGQN